tara:strand:+ start:6976 stop:7173 length:198 start_codon:yes stop_codon:yes gene_type:complete
MLSMIIDYLPWLATGVLSVAGILFKGKYQQFKVVIDTFTKMVEDDKVTPEEWKTFTAEAKKLIGK